MHTGSEIKEVRVFLEGLEVMLNTSAHFPNLEFIDLGSGFKVPYQPVDSETDINDLGKIVAQAFVEFENETGKKFLEDFAIQMSATIPATMLNKNIFKAYIDGVKYLQDAPEVALLGKASTEAMDEKLEAQPIVHTIRAADYLSNKLFSTETFGPASLVVLCKDNAELGEVLHSFEGQLTATVHATTADELAMKSLISIITQKVGRIIFGGYPTGVEVCHSMQHGGPFPATTDSRSTSVGTASIYRFVRPIAYQDFPDHLLPDPLKNDNPLKLFRLVDGNWTSEKI
jgi:NADP-dependent aldehyde dehydrogenase